MNALEYSTLYPADLPLKDDVIKLFLYEYSHLCFLLGTKKL